MKKEQNKNIQKNKLLNNSIQNSSNFNLEEVNKAIELTKFNVCKINIYFFSFIIQKINAKNAFDVNVGFIESITNMISKNEESSWQKASASLDATAKIYGFRVDSVHSETYKFLGGLNRNKKDSNLKNDDIQEEADESKKKGKIKRGVNTLETNIKKLNLSKYDIDSEVDPLFSIMTSKFNESSVKGLLLNTIPLNDNLNYILESKKEENKILTPIENKLEDNKQDKQDDNSNDNESLSNELSKGSGSIKIKD